MTHFTRIYVRLSTVFLILCAVMFSSVRVNAYANSEGKIAAEYLRCEYRVNPLGIDIQNPQLSWVVSSDLRGQAQTAYRILAASSRKKLDNDSGDLWDSGKILSSETTAISYKGKPLQSDTYCYWKVKVWDKDDKASGWSKSACWSAGFMRPSDFKARWITYNTRKSDVFKSQDTEAVNILDDCKWVWFPEGNPVSAVPAQNRYFRKTFKTEHNSAIVKVQLFAAVDNQADLFINNKEILHFESWQSIKQIPVTEHLSTGQNVIAVAATNNGDSDNPAGLIGKLQIEFENGQTQTIKIDSTWKTYKDSVDGWAGVDFDDSLWPDAKEFAANGDGPWGKLALSNLILPPPAYMRKEFKLTKSVESATVYASALGIYKLYMNGSQIGSDYFTPGWTDYDTRVYYNTYDVTDLVKKGSNALGAIVADGWYSGHIGWGQKRDHYGKQTAFFAQLHIRYSDGSSELLSTDSTWKASTGPIVEADFLMGEKYDAQQEIPGWDKPDFDDRNWKEVDAAEKINAKLQSYPGVTVKEFAHIKPVSMTEPQPGVYVFDMGTNFAGFVQLKIKAAPSDIITIRYAERLNPDGTIYTTNLRGARAIDTYICKGGQTETWYPLFTFHGFQYVELTGCSKKPDLQAITGIELTSAAPVAGSFECSDPVANQLYKNICQTQRANFIDIPTDCPQRDERLGWTGDAQVYIRTACMNSDTQAFFTKWLVDLTDGQRTDGQFPNVAPLKVAGDDGGPAWADAGVICPWTIYQIYGDKQILQKHYEAMARFIDFCRSRSTEQLLPPKEYHCYGDWLNINDQTPKDVIYTAYFAYSTKIMSQVAQVLGKQSDAQKYQQLFDRIKAAFNSAYVDDKGRIKGDTQCAYVMAIAFGLLDEQKQQAAADRLVELIENRDWHLSTGFVGTKDLMLALAKINRNDVAYRLFHNDTFPSWGFSIKHGAMSIWERWDGWTPDKGFQDPGMNSFAHYSFGAVGQWMFENIAGIKTDGPGFEKIIIAPQPGGKITFAKTTYNSIRGKIQTHWKIDGDNLIFNITIPANTTAAVFIPANRIKDVTESGKAADSAQAVNFLKMQDDCAVFEIGSGTFKFVSRNAAKFLIPEVTQSSEKIKAVLLTGGHDFEEEPFLEVFSGLDGIDCTHIHLTDDSEIFEDITSWPYDVIVLYNMTQKISKKRQDNFVKLLENGTGLLATHHCAGAFDGWAEYPKIIGYKYFHTLTELDGVSYPPSSYRHDIDMNIYVKDSDHPITRGIKDFVIHDEGYKSCYVKPDCNILLTTDHPDSDSAVCLTQNYRGANVCYLMLGHDSAAYANPNYRRLIANSIRWCDKTSDN